MTASVSYACLSMRKLLDSAGGSIYVANFAQKVMEGQLPLSVRRLRGKRVELFGRSAALVSLFNHHLPFLDHVHEFDADES